jgi:hypothetical protein
MPSPAEPLSYFELRLAASLAAMDTAAEPCARLAQRGLAHRYRALIASGSRADAGLPRTPKLRLEPEMATTASILP